MGDFLPLDLREPQDPDDSPQMFVARFPVGGEEMEDRVLQEPKRGLGLSARHGHGVVAFVTLDRLPLGQFCLRAHQLLTQFRFRGVGAAASFALKLQLRARKT